MSSITLEDIDRQVEEKLVEMLASDKYDRAVYNGKPLLYGVEQRTLFELPSSKLPTLSVSKNLNKVGFTRKEVEYE